MPELAQFQQTFADTLLKNTVGDGELAHPGFAVYRNTWRMALVDALEANFPVVEELIGSPAFGMLTSRYVSANPVSTPVLAGYGANLPAFIEASPLAEPVPYLADVARLEYCIAEIRHAPDANPMDADTLATLSNDALENMRLTMVPAARLMTFATPAVTIWQAHQTPGRVGKLSPEWTVEHAIIVRTANRTAVYAMDPATTDFAAHIIAPGASLGAAAKAIAAAHSDADLTTMLTTLLSSGAFQQKQQGE